MKTFITTAAIAALAGSVVQASDAQDPRIAEARAITKTFAKTLKGELQSAIRTGGVVQGVEICHSRAPEIAKDLANQHGWQVGRTSLRRRNADNTPDDWETATLNRFEEQKAAGRPIEDLEYAATVNQDGQSRFRYMKAIPTQGLCLACHGGDSVSPEVERALQQYYPDDQARGFKEGDIRGAFTLSKRN
jgi:hypothetical protein